MTQVLSESLEDYLEAIYHIVAEKRAARATDISDRLGVNRSSVTGALRALAERGLVNYAPYDIITLTPKGEAAAGDVVHRHEVLRRFFVDVLALPAGVADEAACGMEHHIGKLAQRRLAYLGQFLVRKLDVTRSEWMAEFLAFCQAREEALAGRDDGDPPAAAPPTERPEP